MNNPHLKLPTYASYGPTPDVIDMCLLAVALIVIALFTAEILHTTLICMLHVDMML